LDFLGFIWPILVFSMGYDGKNRKICPRLSSRVGLRVERLNAFPCYGLSPSSCAFAAAGLATAAISDNLDKIA
jgi:hypothetical protein